MVYPRVSEVFKGHGGKALGSGPRRQRAALHLAQ
jgi:hypothetical protein